MDDSEPTFSTEPSSSAMRARAFTWVFTRSCQSTAVFADAVMDFPLRAMFTAGITRDTSPARGPADWGAPKHRPGSELQTEGKTATRRHTGTSSSSTTLLVLQPVSIVWRPRDLSTPNGEPFDHSVHALVSTRRRHHSTAKMEQCRSHIVMLLLSAGKTLDGGEDPAQELCGRSNPLGLAKLLQPFDSKLFSLPVKCVRNPICAEEHRIARLQSQRQRFVARRDE